MFEEFRWRFPLDNSDQIPATRNPNFPNVPQRASAIRISKRIVSERTLESQTLWSFHPHSRRIKNVSLGEEEEEEEEDLEVTRSSVDPSWLAAHKPIMRAIIIKQATCPPCELFLERRSIVSRDRGTDNATTTAHTSGLSGIERWGREGALIN